MKYQTIRIKEAKKAERIQTIKEFLGGIFMFVLIYITIWGVYLIAPDSYWPW